MTTSRVHTAKAQDRPKVERGVAKEGGREKGERSRATLGAHVQYNGVLLTKNSRWNRG